jgi:hypothetical protein
MEDLEGFVTALPDLWDGDPAIACGEVLEEYQGLTYQYRS